MCCSAELDLEVSEGDTGRSQGSGATTRPRLLSKGGARPLGGAGARWDVRGWPGRGRSWALPRAPRGPGGWVSPRPARGGSHPPPSPSPPPSRPSPLRVAPVVPASLQAPPAARPRRVGVLCASFSLYRGTFQRRDRTVG